MPHGRLWLKPCHVLSEPQQHHKVPCRSHRCAATANVPVSQPERLFFLFHPTSSSVLLEHILTLSLTFFPRSVLGLFVYFWFSWYFLSLLHASMYVGETVVCIQQRMQAIFPPSCTETPPRREAGRAHKLELPRAVTIGIS